jgi:hypothetical protein
MTYWKNKKYIYNVKRETQVTTWKTEAEMGGKLNVI